MNEENVIREAGARIAQQPAASGTAKASLFGKLRKEFLYGGHIFAFGSAGVILSTALIGAFRPDYVFLALIYFIYYLIYLYDHSSGAELDAVTNPVRAAYLKSKAQQEKSVFAASALIIAAILLYKHDAFVALSSVLTLVLGVMYGKYFKGITMKVVAFKNYFVAAFWGIIVVYAAICHGVAISSAIWLFALFVFLRMLSIQAFFDIRDTEGDKMKKLRTFPVAYGRDNTVKIIYFLSLSSILLVFAAVWAGYWQARYAVLALSFFYGVFYLRKYQRGDDSSYLWAAGEFLLWTALVLLANALMR
jgi:4-hydroxybenzoate polyprenyltransferase